MQPKLTKGKKWNYSTTTDYFVNSTWKPQKNLGFRFIWCWVYPIFSNFFFSNPSSGALFKFSLSVKRSPEVWLALVWSVLWVRPSFPLLVVLVGPRLGILSQRLKCETHSKIMVYSQSLHMFFRFLSIHLYRYLFAIKHFTDLLSM